VWNIFDNMFYVKATNDTGFDKIVLEDKALTTAVEIIPSCGAILHAFTTLHNGAVVNVIDGYSDKDDFVTNVTAKGFKSCKLSPFACRIKNATYNFAQKEYTVQKFLLNGSALHGLLFDVQFEIIETWANEESAGVLLLHQYKATDNGYPFIYNCEVRYELRKENALTISTTIINKEAFEIPIQDGWHPYFTFGGAIDDLQLEFQSKEIIEFDAALIPTGKLMPYEEFGALKKIGDTFFDSCFVLNFAECQPLCVLRDKVQKIQVEIYPDKSYPYLQIYTPPHRTSIAIENLSAVPDVFNNGIGFKILAPKASAHFTTTYKITSL
jgi:aldose 1-epimerase